MTPFATSRRIEWNRNVIRITGKVKLKRRGADIRTPLNIFVRESGLPRYSVSIHPAILPKAIPRDSYDKTSESSNEHKLNRIKRKTEEHLVDAQKLLPGNRDAEEEGT